METTPLSRFLRIFIALFGPVLWLALGAAAQSQSNHFPLLTIPDEKGASLSLFSPEAYRKEFHYLQTEFKKIDLLASPVETDGWTHNIPEAEWPLMAFAYLGYACANFAECDPSLRDEALVEMRWLIDALQTPRMSGFVTPHFGQPFHPDKIHVAVFLHGHFLNLATRYREVSDDQRYDTLIHRVAAALLTAYQGTDGPILRSYRDMWWITDNFPALAALHRYERLFQRDTTAARSKFLSELKTYYLDPDTGLFCTYINPQGHIQMQGARGISVMYGLHFLKEMDPAFAADQYRLAKQNFVRTLFGFSAVREFPENSRGRGDIDSGPILMGLGPSASGFAIAAAAVNHDDATAWDLLKASALVGLPHLQDGKLQYAAMPIVGQAVILFGKTELLKSDRPPGGK